MRVLFVTPELPHPPYTGAHTRPLSMMRALAAAGHEIVAVGLLPDGPDGPDPGATTSQSGAGADPLRELCAEVVALPSADARDSRRALLSRGRKLLSPVPLIGKGYDPILADLIARTAARVRPQALHLLTMYAVHYASLGGPPGDGCGGSATEGSSPGSYPAVAAPAHVPAVVDLTDVVSGLCETAALARPLRYAAARLQTVSSRRQERRLLAGMLPVTINDDDRERLARLGVAAFTVPLAVELPDLEAAHDAIAPRGSDPGATAADLEAAAAPDAPVELLFIGSMLHAPNREAAHFLIEKVAPELRRLDLRFRLAIAGRDARPQTLGLHRIAGDQPRVASSCGTIKMEQLNPALSATGIEFFPDVPDLAPLYRRADIVLAPLPHGGGTKNKTLEAMAFARPVVGTPQSFTGLTPDARAAYAETPYDAAAMAQTVAALAADPPLRARMARRGREYVAAHHSQELVNRRVRVLYDAIGRGEGIAAAEAAGKDGRR
jgi:glycosyltransferase involved in cell wall biosynthesis